MPTGQCNDCPLTAPMRPTISAHTGPTVQAMTTIAIEQAYKKGWIAAARWATRDDLIADVGSRAYTSERDAALAAQPERQLQALDEAMEAPKAMARAYENGYNAALANGPAWHDAPNKPGLWVDGINLRALRFTSVDIGTLRFGECRWYGPIPEDTK